MNVLGILRRICRVRAVAFVFACCGLVACHPVYETRTAEFATEVQCAVNPTDLQVWAVTVLAREPIHVGQTDIPKESVPAALRNLESHGSAFQGAYRDGDGIVLFWGGGFGHWGIVVGSEAFQIPKTREAMYYLPWKPGIYFWHEKE